LLNAAVVLCIHSFQANAAAQDSSSSSIRSRAHATQKERSAQSSLDAGSVSAGTYRNPAFGFAWKIPAGWVLRTEEMNERDYEGTKKDNQTATDAGKGGRVLLAAFSRPPEARAEDVNGSILIAAESAASYPGLEGAAQYFGPVMEVAKAQGFKMDDEPYEFVVGTKTLVRGDFQKDVGTRVMRQSTLVMLAHPQCPCSHASMGELAQVMARVQGKIRAYVLFYTPRESGSDWQNTETRRSAAQIPGVIVLPDIDGAEAERFGAETSGHTFLFDPSGRLLFNGGITASRGHSGDNVGESALVSLIDNHTAKVGQTFVFGCSFKTQSRGDLKCSR